MIAKSIKFVTGPMRVWFLLLPPVCVILGISTAFNVIGRINPGWSLLALCFLGLLTSPIAVLAIRGAYKFGNDISKLLPYMGLNVVPNLSTPLLVALGFFLRTA